MKPKLILILASLVILASFIFTFLIIYPKIHIPKKVIESSKTTSAFYKITRVVDGDTFEINMNGRQEKVRLIGLDTPETKKPNSPVECFGIAASNYAHQILDNQSVRLEYDPINTNRDRYGRLLRYAYLNDGRMVNTEMIKQGYGFAYLSFPFTKTDEFRQYQIDARREGKGLWAGECQIHNENGRSKTNSI